MWEGVPSSLAAQGLLGILGPLVWGGTGGPYSHKQKLCFTRENSMTQPCFLSSHEELLSSTSCWQVTTHFPPRPTARASVVHGLFSPLSLPSHLSLKLSIRRWLDLGRVIFFSRHNCFLILLISFPLKITSNNQYLINDEEHQQLIEFSSGVAFMTIKKLSIYLCICLYAYVKFESTSSMETV